VKSFKQLFIQSPRFFLVLMFLMLSSFAQAENSKEYAEHIVYVNAFPIDSLPAEMTKQYGLKRSKNFALVNVSVMEKGTGSPVGVRSKVTGTLKNLMGQSRSLEFREIKEGQAIYYIAQIGVPSRETVNFFIEIRPESNKEKYEIKFSKTF
jgi:hypothetical protein